MKEFDDVESRLKFPELENEVLDFWEEQDIFQKSLDKDSPEGNFVFMEGPPTANGKPGIHHVLSRTYKDIIARLKTMQGFHVERKAGWDTHGLPVELEVEKELGISGKQDIENIVEGDRVASIEKFNKLAKERVLKFTEEWESLTERMGFWLDMDDPYITFDPDYIETLWWIVKEIDKRDLLERGHKVLPYCPRCGTPLSSHEVAQGYEDITDRSVYVKFELVDEEDTYLLAWTTTPWTLPGNVALAVNNDLDYARVETDEGDIILASELVEEVFDEDTKVAEIISGSELVGKEYEPLFDFVDLEEESGQDAYFVTEADFVTLEEGTGIVHTAVMYGEEDYELGEEIDLPKVHTVDTDGKFNDLVPKWEGQKVKDPDTEAEIIEYLKENGKLLKELDYTHSYPHCWRCDTPLLYYARSSWVVRMSELRDQLVENNEDINWVPDHMKEGRFGEWIREVKDWSFSRERYWGTPLPVWVNEEDEDDYIVIGSFEELRKLAKDPEQIDEDFDPHRPYVDEIELEKDGNTYTRVEDVADVWFDSGAVPFAQWHYPFENHEKIDDELAFPADYISEAVDQTRGWFYTLLATSTLLEAGAPYRNVVVLGHIMDKDGKKMSTSKGNIVDPWEAAEDFGMDPIRWFFFSNSDPELPKNFDPEVIEEYIRKFFLTLWNSYKFFVTYAQIDEYQPEGFAEKPENPEHILDEWLIERVQKTVTETTDFLEEYNFLKAARGIEELTQDLSNWYIRRSRRRFWKSENDADKSSAFDTLYYALGVICKLIAPFSPFLPEKIYQNMKTDSDPDSIHLTEWPEMGDFDANLLEEMKEVREVVEEGLRLRDEAEIKVRQPLSTFTVDQEFSEELEELIRNELNVKEVEVGSEVSLDMELTEDLIREGMMRDAVRFIQKTRKNTGLEVTDRIKLMWDTESPEVERMIEEYGDHIKKEVLADELKQDEGLESEHSTELREGELIISIDG